MFFQTPAFKIFFIGFIAFGLASCDQNNATKEGQTEDAETITLPVKTLSLEELKPKLKTKNRKPSTNSGSGITVARAFLKILPKLPAGSASPPTRDILKPSTI